LTIHRRITAGMATLACTAGIAACGSSSGSSANGNPVVSSAAFLPYCQTTLTQQRITAKQGLASTCQCIQRIIRQSGHGGVRVNALPAGGFKGAAAFLAGGCGATVTSPSTPGTTTT
jgi:hypothetical protein